MNLLVMLRLWLVRAGFRAALLRPLRRRVVLATFHGDAITGNLAWLRDEIVRRPRPAPVSVFAHRASRGLRGRLRAASASLRAGWLLGSSRVVIVDDYFFPMYAIRPRDGTTFVQVWHACGAFKRFGYSVGDREFGADAALLRRVRIHANYACCLVSSRSVAPHYAEAFGQPLERFTSRYGIPRTDLFFDEARITRTAADLRRRYGLPGGRRVILYAPTFRGASVTRARDDGLLDLAAMQATLGADHVVLLRLHPFVRSRGPLDPALAGFVIDVSDHADINELMLVSDLLVTDYSSAIYEFALLGRPILFFAPDLDAYERERGFYFDYRSGVPGPVFETTEALARYIRAGAFERDREQVAAFRAASFDVADGHASARLVEELLLPALDGRTARS